MKKVLILLSAICLTVSFVACDPDEVDAFAYGYRQGYSSSVEEPQEADIPEQGAENVQNSVEINQ